MVISLSVIFMNVNYYFSNKMPIWWKKSGKSEFVAMKKIVINVLFSCFIQKIALGLNYVLVLFAR